MDKKLIAIILLLISLWFYWFQYRPTKIRRECWRYTQDNIKIDGDSDIKRTDFDKYIKATDFVYEDCLRMKGLE